MKIKDLINAVSKSDDSLEDKRDALEFIEQRIQYMVNYVNAVVMMNVSTPILYAKSLDQEDLIDKIQSLDKKRKMTHDVAIGACVQLDRQCDYYQCERICGLTPEKDINGEITVESRKEFASFIGNFINDIFQEEIYVDRTDDFVKNVSNKQLGEILDEMENMENEEEYEQ